MALAANYLELAEIAGGVAVRRAADVAVVPAPVRYTELTPDRFRDIWR
jgi:hypothetical protein